MEQPAFFQLKASLVPFQLLRPLPTIFACVRGVCEATGTVKIPTKVKTELKSHLDYLCKSIESISKMINLPKSQLNDILEKSKHLLESKENTLCEKTCELSLAIEKICEKHKISLKEE